MNGTMKHAKASNWGRMACRWLITSAALVWANGLLAEDAQSAGTTTTAATAAAASSVTMASDRLPLLIPDDAWKRLTTLTADQKAQLTALQTGLYSDQLTTINSLTNQAQTLRTALATAGLQQMVFIARQIHETREQWGKTGWTGFRNRLS